MADPTSTPTAPDSSATSAPPTSRTQTSGNLYLVTFLATLFLLLFVSCAIVLRSYILRRRYQRRLDEAMAAGMLLAPRAPGSRRKRFGTKPKLHDTWLTSGGNTWETMLPLSAQPVFVKRRFRDAMNTKPMVDDTDVQATPTPPAEQTPRTRFALPLQQASWWQRRRARHVIVPAGPETPAPSGLPPKIRVEMLQISTLIAMPSPSRSQRKNKALALERKLLATSDAQSSDYEDDEEEPPLSDVVFGVTRVHNPLAKNDVTLLSVPPLHLQADSPQILATPLPTPPLTRVPTPTPTPAPAPAP